MIATERDPSCYTSDLGNTCSKYNFRSSSPHHSQQPLPLGNIPGWAPNSDILLKDCFSLLHVLRESLKEAAQRQIEGHCSPLAHSSWLKNRRGTNEEYK